MHTWTILLLQCHVCMSADPQQLYILIFSIGRFLARISIRYGRACNRLLRAIACAYQYLALGRDCITSLPVQPDVPTARPDVPTKESAPTARSDVPTNEPTETQPPTAATIPTRFRNT